MSSQNLFGAPTSYDPVSLQRWIRLLLRAWHALVGRPPERLRTDLDELRSIFGNGASAKAIKMRVYELPEADAEMRTLPSEVALLVDDCALITPEGRILLEVLQGLQKGGTGEIDLGRQLAALTTANTLRGEWHAQWLTKQFKSNLSPAAIGAALFLLINGCVGEAKALEMPSDGQRDRELGRVIMPLVAGFSESLGKSPPATDEGIRQHWAFTQVSRLLGREVAREKGDRGTVMFVRENREHNLLEKLGHLLANEEDARRQAAVLQFVEGYRRSRGKLAAFGQMHEDPTQTDKVARLLTRGVKY